MKYHCFLGTLCVLASIWGATLTAQADNSISSPTPEATSPPTQVNGTAKSTASPAMTDLEFAIYNRVNIYRMSLDLPPLVIDPVISAQAKAHSEAMAQMGSMNHDRFRERVDSVAQTIPFRSAAENVATNFGHDRPDVVAIDGWIESEGHHRNMIGRYDLTGVGVAQDAKGEYYFTQIFIRRLKQ
jgi:uncharacterized protein YkwD